MKTLYLDLQESETRLLCKRHAEELPAEETAPVEVPRETDCSSCEVMRRV